MPRLVDLDGSHYKCKHTSGHQSRNNNRKPMKPPPAVGENHSGDNADWNEIRELTKASEDKATNPNEKLMGVLQLPNRDIRSVTPRFMTQGPIYEK